MVAHILVALVALLHSYFLVLEMFLWTTPKTAKAFGRTVEQQQASAVLAKNQGLYNGFLAAGLVWSYFVSFSVDVRLFFLLCVIVAGLYGAATANKRILFVQAVPAALALTAVLLHL
jgi:putative membrane protein